MQTVEDKWQSIDLRSNEFAKRMERGLRPAPGSSLAKDDELTDPGQISHTIARLFAVSVDSLLTVTAVRLGANVSPTYGSYTLVRTVFEAAGTGLWLLSGTVDRNERIRRSLQYDRQDCYDEAKTLDTLHRLRKGRGQGTTDLPDRNAKKTECRDQLREVAGRRAIDPGTFEGRLVISSVLTEVGNEYGFPSLILAWQMCSAHAHGRRWAFLNTLNLEVISEAGEGVVTIRATSDPEKIVDLVTQACALVGLLLQAFDKRATNHTPANAS